MKANFVYFVLFILLLIACKKHQYRYPEDKTKTRLTPDERLLGHWRATEYTLNGISIIGTSNKISQWEYQMSYMYDEYNGRRFELVGDYTYNNYFSYDAFNDFHYITLHSSSEAFNRIFVTPFKSVPNTTTKWTVTKLYDLDLSIQLITDTGEYKIVFKKYQY